MPIAAVGIQGHWMLDHVPYKDIEKAINEFQKLGVKAMITELDLDVVPRQADRADINQVEKVWHERIGAISEEILSARPNNTRNSSSCSTGTETPLAA